MGPKKLHMKSYMPWTSFRPNYYRLWDYKKNIPINRLINNKSFSTLSTVQKL